MYRAFSVGMEYLDIFHLVDRIMTLFYLFGSECYCKKRFKPYNYSWIIREETE